MASQINDHLRTGQLGEHHAATYLRGQGYKVLRQNYRYKRAEIDIIAQKDNLLVFVEVKTRSTNRYGYPEEAVNFRKEQMLQSAADEFILQQEWQHEVRFDIVAVTLSSPPAIHHIEDAFF